jgi:hypothetical protein
MRRGRQRHLKRCACDEDFFAHCPLSGGAMRRRSPDPGAEWAALPLHRGVTFLPLIASLGLESRRWFMRSGFVHARSAPGVIEITTGEG